jgi:hypothetical protein
LIKRTNHFLKLVRCFDDPENVHPIGQPTFVSQFPKTKIISDIKRTKQRKYIFLSLPDERRHAAAIANLPTEHRRRVPLPFEGPPPEDHPMPALPPQFSNPLLICGIPSAA